MQKTKILAVIPAFLNPSEVWMYRQLQAFSKQDLRVIAYKNLNRPEFPLDEGVVVEVPVSSSEPLQGWRRMWDRLAHPNQGGPRFGSVHRDWLRDQIRDFSPDMIHCQYGTYGLSTLYVAQTLNVPVFVQFNGHDLTSFIQRKRPRKQLVDALNDFSGLIAVANYQRQWLLANGADEERIAMIPYGAPKEPLLHVTRKPIAECRFLMVGRLCEMKAPTLAIRAFHHCLSKHAQCRLTIIGDGELREDVDKMISQLSLSNHVRILGVQPPHVVRSEMLRSDVFVQHSVTAKNGTKEGWPVAIGEAMSRGLPILSTRHAGIVQQVIPAVNGWLCDEHDWNTMGKQMIDLVKNPARRIAMGQLSKRLALDCQKQCELQYEFMLEKCGLTTQSHHLIAS